MRVEEIKDGEGECARGTIRRGAPGGVGKLGDAAALRARGDHRRVVGAGDGDGHGLGGRAAMAVSDSDDVALGELLASGEEIEGSILFPYATLFRSGLPVRAVLGDGIE